MTAPVDDRIVWVDYTSRRGERKWLRILPKSLVFGATEGHPDPQWLLEAYNLDRGAYLVHSYALRDIHAWRSSPPEKAEPEAEPSRCPACVGCGRPLRDAHVDTPGIGPQCPACWANGRRAP